MSRNPTAPEIKTLEDVNTAFLAHHRELKAVTDTANAEIADCHGASPRQRRRSVRQPANCWTP